MSISVTLNGSPYTVPQDGDTYAWGAPLTQYLQAISLQMLQKNTPLFTITQDLDFGTSFGLVVQFIKSHGVPIATTGLVRLANGEVLGWRNNLDTGNVTLGIGATNELELNGIPISGIMVIDNLLSFSATAALSANQGRILNDLILASGGASGIADVVLKSNIEKTGGDYPINDQITLSEAAVRKNKIEGTLASNYTSGNTVIVITWDSDPPIAPFILQIYDPTVAGVSRLLYVNSFNSGSFPTITYNCANLGVSLLAANGIVITNSGLQISSGTLSLDETLLVNEALMDSYHITKSRFKVAPFTGDMDWSFRWWNQSFHVVSTNATTIVVTDIADSAANSNKDVFLLGDKIIFFPKIWNGLSYDPVYDTTIGNNYKEITLTANATWLADQLTFTHASGDNNHFLADTDFYVVRKSATFFYSAGDGSSSNLATEPVVDEFFPVSRGNFGFFADTFDRSPGPVGNNWTNDDPNADINPTGQCRIYDNANSDADLHRDLEDYSFKKLPIELYFEAQMDSGGTRVFAPYFSIGGTSGFNSPQGIGVHYDDVSALWRFYVNGVDTGTSFSFANPVASDFVFGRIQFYKSVIRMKVWNVTLGQIEPNAWNEYDNGTDFNITANDGRLYIGSFDNVVQHMTRLYYFSAQPVDLGFISSGTVSGLTTVSQITGYSRLKRNDTKDKPLVFQRDIKIKPN
jgi:hypothetical protein